MKGYVSLLLSALGVFVLLQTGCYWAGSGYYSRYPYPYYDSYWYPYGSYYWRPYSYGSYYWYPYGSYSWWPYRSYHYRDYRYPHRYRERYDDDHSIGPPRSPQRPPPERKPSLLEPNKPKGGQRPPLDRPFLRKNQPKR